MLARDIELIVLHLPKTLDGQHVSQNLHCSCKTLQSANLVFTDCGTSIDPLEEQTPVMTCKCIRYSAVIV